MLQEERGKSPIYEYGNTRRATPSLRGQANVSNRNQLSLDKLGASANRRR